MEAIGRFEIQSTIRYDSVKPDLTLSLPGFMQYVQEVSIQNTENTLFPMSWLIENNCGWVITQWDVIINSYPKYNEKIKLRTWPTYFKGFFGERSYEAISENGKTLLTANANWIYTDLVKRRPIRPSIEHADSYGELLPHAHKRNFSMPNIDQRIADGTFILQTKDNIRVTRRDIDTNGHVNNINYFTWVFDIIPEDKYIFGNISHMKTIYRKECRLGDVIQIEYFENQSKESHTKKCESMARITNDGIVLAEIFLNWE